MERTTIRPVRPALGSNNHRTAFNLFRRKREPDLLCAVPQDCPVPGFVEASAWAFVGTVREPTTVLSGFNRRAAEASVRVNGFYLFEADLIEPNWITVAPRREQPRTEAAPPWMPDAAALSGIAEAGAGRPERRAS